MPEWNDINDLKPSEYEEVLVASDLAADGYLRFFVATYNQLNNQWRCYFDFKNKDFDMRLSIQVLENDKWKLIEWPKE